MIKASALVLAVLLTGGVVIAQNTNSPTSPTTRDRTTSNTNQAKTPAASPQQAPGSEGVLAAFNALLDGIRHASVNEVMGVYWNSPRLNLFNYNGTVTKGWEQVRKNRDRKSTRLNSSHSQTSYAVFCL